MPTAPTSTRRGFLALGGAGLAAALTACSGRTPRADAGGGSVPTAQPTPSLSPDVALATLALAELRAARDAVTATTTGFPGLAAALAPVAAMHQAHEEALVDAVPEGSQPATAPAPYTLPARRPVALATLQQREADLQARLGELAVQARSGVFASLLASMSAGTAQRVVSWPT